MKLFLILLLSVTTSFAGFKMGKYTGVDKSGSDCEITFHITSYTNGIKNPINEEIYASIPGHRELFVLTHMPSLDSFTGAITVEKSFLKDFKGTYDGALALSVELIDGYVSHGPTAFSYIQHNWKSKTSKSKICTNLQLVD